MFLNIQNQERNWIVSTIGHISTKSCVVDCSKEYLKHYSTKVQTYTKTLFITYGKPSRAATIDSMRRWVKHLFIEMSILKQYIPHTCRSAATRKANQLNVDTAKILKQGCWKNAKTFFNSYKKDIVYYAPEDVEFMSILTWNIYVHMLFIFTFRLAKQNVYNTIYIQHIWYV